MFYVFLFSLFLICNSTKQKKLCIDCKYFMHNRKIFDQKMYGRCTLFPQKNSPLNYLVPGIDDKLVTTSYFYCFTARNDENMCGNEGKKFEFKNSENITNSGEETPCFTL